MDIIPIQASSVPCERVFSSGKQTMAPRRSRISAHLMESLQILKFSIRKGRAIKFTEGMGWSEELKEFEIVARTAPVGDAEAYGRSLEDDEEDSEELENALEELKDDLMALEDELVADLEDNEEEQDDDDVDDFYV
jgi:hAT family C-terminal dimerisation region